MQGMFANNIDCTEKVETFKKKISPWKCRIQGGNVGSFPILDKTHRQVNPANTCRKYCCSPLTPSDHYSSILSHGSFISRMDTVTLLGRYG